MSLLKARSILALVWGAGSAPAFFFVIVQSLMKGRGDGGGMEGIIWFFSAVLPQITTVLTSSHDCDLRTEADPPVYLWSVSADIIKTVHFGWAYNSAWIVDDIASLKNAGAKPIFYSANANRETGLLESKPI